MGLFSKKNVSLSDADLIREIARGNEAAFNEIYRRYHQRLFHYFLGMLGRDRSKAEDFLQDLFLKVVKNATSFRSDGQFSSWLYTIAANMCKNEYRHLAVRQGLERLERWEDIPENSDFPQLPLASLMQEELKDRVTNFLETLDIQQRATFILRYQEHLSIKEISSILDCAEGTTKSRLYHLHKKLAHYLKSYRPSGKESV